MPSLFRRKSEDVVETAGTSTEEAPAGSPVRAKNYTPSKRELGKVTPKRRDPHARKAEPPPANRREAVKRMREKQREERAESRAGMMAGDERYLLPRDRGPERAMARDVVDSRRTFGTWFFGTTFLVFVGANPAMPPIVQFVSNGIFALMAAATVFDSAMLCRQVGRLLQERFPQSEVRPRKLYLYVIMRGITFRRMRVPKPRVKIGETV